jgi:hypothetical protein
MRIVLDKCQTGAKSSWDWEENAMFMADENFCESVRSLGREGGSGVIGETQERTCVAIVPRMEGRSTESLECVKWTERADRGVAMEDSVGAERREVLPILSVSP